MKKIKKKKKTFIDMNLKYLTLKILNYNSNLRQI